MRTTLSLDDDVAGFLAKEVRRTGVSFKEAVNHYLRLGLMVSRQKNKPFTVSARPLGLPPGLSYDNIAELLETLEAER